MEKIVVIEDEMGIRESLNDILELSGYEVVTASNGKEGLMAIIENKPDLVLCDVNMPEMDGFEVLSALNERMKDQVLPPFLFLTARVELTDIRKGMSLGADDYIIKPFEHTDLLQSIRMRLEKRGRLLVEKEERNPGDRIAVHATESNKLAIPNEEGLTLVPFGEILFCQADRAYCRFYLKSGEKILVSKSMKEFEDILIDHGFVKVHKSNIVNIVHAEKYLRGKGGQLLMTDGSLVPVAVRKKEELMTLLRS